MKIAIDGMGGDRAPGSIVAGMALAHRRLPHLSFLLFGDQARLKPLLARNPELEKAVTLHHTPEVVGPALKPADAIRGLKKSSMRLAVQAAADGDADAVVSAGNTGAYMALSKLILKTLPGISRPAIISQMPNLKGESVFLDLGGNLVCNARNLVEFAIMGSLFAKNILFRKEPTVGLMNIGSEDTKGRKEIQEAARVLKDVLPGFQGFVEGSDLGKGTVDVFVADGFAGNVALKTAEGTALFLMESLKKCFMQSWRGRLAGLLAAPLLRAMRYQLDPRKYNGACWLGLSGLAVKSHGGTDALGFSYAIEVAVDMAKTNLTGAIRDEIQALDLEERLAALHPPRAKTA